MSFNMDSLGAYGLSNYDTSSTSATNQGNKLKNSLENIDNATDEELMQVCKEFETYMIEQVIKSMKSTIGDDEESSTSYEDMFGDNLTTSYAKAISDEGKLGLAQMLYESMKRQ